MFKPIPFDQIDPQFVELIAHGRVNASVATGHLQARFTGQRSQSTHEGAANAKNVNMHGRIVEIVIVRSLPVVTPGTICLMDSLQFEIAAAVAALVVEQGLEYGPAKRRVIKSLGLSGRSVLPDNTSVETAVREYIALYCGETQPAELAALRVLALEWMERMAEFRPHLAGAVWQGTATRLSDIYIQLFCDGSKVAEISLINHNVDYEPRSVTGFHGETVEALSLHADCRALKETVGVHLMIYDYDDMRIKVRQSGQVSGRQSEGATQAMRGDLTAVRKLVEAQT